MTTIFPATYEEIQGPYGHLASRRPFRGSSMSALVGAEDGAYLVFSYTTQIASLSQDGRHLDIAENRWGKTTARHINLCHAWLPRAVEVAR